jgi:hypothetical protein
MSGRNLIVVPAVRVVAIPSRLVMPVVLAILPVVAAVTLVAAVLAAILSPIFSVMLTVLVSFTSVPIVPSLVRPLLIAVASVCKGRHRSREQQCRSEQGQGDNVLQHNSSSPVNVLQAPCARLVSEAVPVMAVMPVMVVTAVVPTVVAAIDGRGHYDGRAGWAVSGNRDRDGETARRCDESQSGKSYRDDEVSLPRRHSRVPPEHQTSPWEPVFDSGHILRGRCWPASSNA